MTTENRDLDHLRAKLFDLLDGVKSGAIDLDKARVLNEIGKTQVATAVVEVNYLKASGGGQSAFIPAIANGNLPHGLPGTSNPSGATSAAAPAAEPPLPPGITRVVRHRLER